MNRVHPTNAELLKQRNYDSGATGDHSIGMEPSASGREGRISPTIPEQQKKKSKAAFTLIEVLIAMFVSVFAVSSTYMLIAYSRDILRSSSNRLEALNGTRGAVEYLRTLDFNADELDVGNHSTTLNGQSFQYNIVLYDGDADLKQITVQTAWQSELSDATRQVELVSMVSLPLHSE